MISDLQGLVNLLILLESLRDEKEGQAGEEAGEKD